MPGLGSEARACPTTSSSRRTRRRSPRSSIRRRPPRTSSGSRASGLDGRFGFYEAIDYRPRAAATPTRHPAIRDSPPIVRAYLRASPGHVARRRSPTCLQHDAFVARFHADPRVQATELLLQERVPREAILSEPRPAESTTAPPSLPVFASRRFRSPHTASPHAHVPLERPLHDARSPTPAAASAPGATWRSRGSATTGPTTAARISSTCAIRGRTASGRRPICPSASEPDAYDVTFDLDKVDVPARATATSRRTLQVAVSSGGRRRGSPAVDHQPRRSAARDRGHELRRDRAGTPEDDVAHPAFGKLFVETEFDPQSAGLALQPAAARASDEAPDLGVPRARRRRAACAAPIEWETDRARFIGRGRSPANPVALDGRALSGTTGAVLDPVAALRERVRLAPGAFVRMTFATGVAPDRDAALALARKYRDGSAAARVLSMAFTHVHIDAAAPGAQRRSGDPLRSAGFARVRVRSRRCISPADLAANTLGQSNLWGYGISGDLPIVLVRVTEPDALPLVRQVLRAQEYWRVKGLRADVVILNEHPAEYLDETQNHLTRSCRNRDGPAGSRSRAACSSCATDGMPEADRRLLAAVARVVLRRRSRRARRRSCTARRRWLYRRGRARSRASRVAGAASEPVSPSRRW